MLSPIFLKVLPQHEALGAIVAMRVAALLCLLLALALARFWLGIELAMVPLLAILFALAAFNLWTWQHMRHAHPAGERELYVQLLADIVALSALLYFSGGATNPFVSFYLPALAVAAAMLPWRYALSLAVLSIAAYSLLTDFFVPIHLNDPARAISYHLAGMWANFAVSAALITWFVAGLSRTVRQRDRQLATAREQYLESERLVALGIQAANAAHEIGTPLSTVTIIVGDLQRESARSASLQAYRQEFATIEAQIALCKTALDRLGTQNSGAPDERLLVSIWLPQFVQEWRLRYPAARIDLSLATEQDQLVPSIPVAQILTTLLDNAMRAVAAIDAPIRIVLQSDPRQVLIQVLDSGPGIASDLLPSLGYRRVENPANGRGIGLLLAFATARQIGASIDLSPNLPRGVRATISIPAP